MANVEMTNSQRTNLRRVMSKYYFNICSRVFDIFEPLGIDQIERSKEMKITDFDIITSEEVRQLQDIAETEAYNRITTQLIDNPDELQWDSGADYDDYVYNWDN